MDKKSTESLVWHLVGYDTFEGGPDAWYTLGTYLSQYAAERAAAARLRHLERVQPAAQSGGQLYGIQDQVWIARPDGSRYRWLDQSLEQSGAICS
jgi:hypothetical protein